MGRRIERKLYVGNLNYELTADDLRTAFERFGQIEDSVVITNRETGCSRGFGFVTFAEPSQADAALKEMIGFYLGGRPIRVKIAEAREQTETFY
jgi:cold-inducible RNA-binding protein